MDIATTIHELRHHIATVKKRGQNIGFVPTMGALHAGHMQLVKQARQECEYVVVSIFVNPTQFAAGEDFAKYPRPLEADQALLEQAQCDLLFLPEPATIYPMGHQTRVQVLHLGKLLCERFRPGHFQGVATIVNILFNLVQPDCAYFGLKDYQQFTLLRRMVLDLAMPIAMQGIPTVRESDGLAMSSRNRYLNPEERQQATALYRALQTAQKARNEGQTDGATVEALAYSVLNESGIHRIDYVQIVDANTLIPVVSLTEQSNPVMLIAAYVGRARLIDNLILT